MPGRTSAVFLRRANRKGGKQQSQLKMGGKEPKVGEGGERNLLTASRSTTGVSKKTTEKETGPYPVKKEKKKKS